MAGSNVYELEADDTDGDREGLAITCPNGCTSHPAERERVWTWCARVLPSFCPILSSKMVSPLRKVVHNTIYFQFGAISV